MTSDQCTSGKSEPIFQSIEIYYSLSILLLFAIIGIIFFPYIFEYFCIPHILLCNQNNRENIFRGCTICTSQWRPAIRWALIINQIALHCSSQEKNKIYVYTLGTFGGIWLDFISKNKVICFVWTAQYLQFTSKMKMNKLSIASHQIHLFG